MKRDLVNESPETHHPELQMLADLLSGDIEDDDLRSVVIPHLLARCPGCRRQAETIRTLMERFDHWSESIVVRESREAPRLLAELLAIPRDHRLATLDGRDELHTWGLCQLLLRRCRSTWVEDAERALELAEMAVAISERLPGEGYHPDWVADLRARSWAHLGNTRRLVDELRSAESAFHRALMEIPRGTGRVCVEAEVLDLLASLRLSQRCMQEAVALQAKVADLWRSENKPHRAARAILAQARALEESGEVETALSLLERATADIDVDREPRLLRCAWIVRLHCLLSLGRATEARRHLPKLAELFAEAPEADRIRLRWNEGQIAHALATEAGDEGSPEWAEAEAAFREVQRYFLDQGRSYDTALVSLDLALVSAEQGKFDQVAELAAEVLPVFRSQGVAREAMASWLLIRRAVESRTATVEMVREMRRLVARRR